jgi:hypothetical protein
MNHNAISQGPTVGERVELDRYRTAGAERILYGQRIDGVVRITDRPATETGRSYLIETGLEQDGYAALKALVTDYVREARRLEAVPMASSALRQELQLQAA